MPPLAQCDAFGFIYDQAGAPSAGTLVTLKKVVDADGNPILLGPLVTTTDATGAYHFTLPQNSTAYVSARADTLWSCNGGTAMLVPATASGELIPAFAPPASFAVAPPLMFVSNVLSLPRASATQDGYLSAADWALFNAGGTGTAGVLTFNGRSGVVVPLQTDYAVFTPTVPGMVPAPGAPSTTKYLRDDGTWQIPPGGGSSTGTGLLPSEYLATDFNISASANRYSGSIGSGSTLLTTTTATDFKTGQGIYIAGAGASGAPLITKVTSVSGTSIVLQNAAGASVTAVANNVQHDETVALQGAFNTICNSGGGTLWMPPGVYRVNGPLLSTNSILTVPHRGVDSTTQHLGLRVIGTSPQPWSAFLGPASSTPSVNVAVIQTDRIASASASIFAAALYDPDYNNVMTPNATTLYFEDITFRTYDNPQISALDLAMCVQPFLRNVIVDTGMNMLAGAEPMFATFGLRLARNNVTYECYTDNVEVQNYGIGIIFSEEWRASYVAVIRCKIGLQNTFGYHPNGPCSMLIWHCPTGINFTDRSAVDFSIDWEIVHDTTWEAASPGRDLYDPLNKATGFIKTHKSGGNTGTLEPVSYTGCVGLTLQSLNGFGSTFAGQLTMKQGGVEYAITADANDTAGTNYRRLRIPNAASGDTTAPVISAVTATGITGTGAVITWTTDENADSQVEYGPTIAYGNSTVLDSTLTTSHSVTLSGLTSSMAYHYRVKSADAAANLQVSSDHTFTTSSAGGPDLLSGLVSYWKLDETAAPFFDSVTATANNLSAPIGIASTAGKPGLGSAIDATATGYFLVGSDNPSLNFTTTGFSCCGWFKLNVMGGFQYFISKWFGAEQEWLVRADPAPDIGFYISKTGTDAVAAIVPITEVVGQWYFFAAVYNKAAGQIRLSINDGTVTTAAFAGPMFHGSQSLGILTGAGAQSNCAVDEIGLWNRVLTAAEITALYNGGSGVTYPFP